MIFGCPTGAVPLVRGVMEAKDAANILTCCKSRPPENYPAQNATVLRLRNCSQRMEMKGVCMHVSVCVYKRARHSVLDIKFTAGPGQ